MKLHEFKKTVTLGGTLVMLMTLILSANPAFSREGRLLVGWGVADITPDKPVALVGQLHKRISKGVQDPLTATVLALETTGENGRKEQAIMVSCDLLFIRGETQKKLQAMVAQQLTGFDASKLFLNALHSHTSPGFMDEEFKGLYDISNDKGVMKPSEFEQYFLRKVTPAIMKAWQERKPGGYSWGLGNAMLGHNRRTVKFDGTARMYGVGDPGFFHYEGTDDNKVQILFFWNEKKSLTGMVVNTTTTAQVTDGISYVSADFYNETRQNLKKEYGDSLYVLFQVGSAGDITPSNHEYIYSRAEKAMLQRKGVTARQELANRLTHAIGEVMPFADKDISENVIFRHTVAKVALPVKDPPSPPFYITDDVNPAEIHVLRLGDIAIASNPFELFNDYGLMIKARSKAILTFLVQLSCHHSGYLPTERAEKGGGYSADKYLVGQEGGLKLVDETVKHINTLWQE